MNSLDNEIKKYLNDVKKNLICSFKTKKQILSSVRSSVYDYAEENNIQDIKDIYSHFGTPPEIAQVYLPEPDINIIKRCSFLKGILLAMLICILAWLVFFLTGLLCIYSELEENEINISPAIEITSSEFETFQERSNHEQP